MCLRSCRRRVLLALTVSAHTTEIQGMHLTDDDPDSAYRSSRRDLRDSHCQAQYRIEKLDRPVKHLDVLLIRYDTITHLIKSGGLATTSSSALAASLSGYVCVARGMTLTCPDAISAIAVANVLAYLQTATKSTSRTAAVPTLMF